MPAESSSKPPSAGALGAILRAAGVRRDSVIRVTGPGGLAALLWFCRHGFDQVGYLRPGRCPSDPGDVVFVTQTCDRAALARLLDEGPSLRGDGLLIVQTPEVAQGAGPDPYHGLLETHGYRVERCIHGRRRELHIARRRPAASLRRAA